MENDLKNILERMGKKGLPEDFIEGLRELRAFTYLDKKIRLTGHELGAIIGSVTSMIIAQREGKDLSKKEVDEIGTEVFKLLPQIFKQLEK